MAALLPKSSADDSEDKFHDAYGAGFEDHYSSQPWPWRQVLSSLILASYLPELPAWFAAAAASHSRSNLYDLYGKGASRATRAAAAALHVPIVVRQWALWAIVLAAATLFAWDPLRIRHMIAISNEFHHHACQNAGIECCRPLPDVNEWPADPENKLLRSEFFSSTGIPGPETLAWDLQGRGPYTGVADGRIIRWNQQNGSFDTFAYVSPYWTDELCAYENRGRRTSKLELEHICGRPLGLKFHPVSGELFIADAYFGLAKVGREGGRAEVLTNESEGVVHKFTNDLAIHENGTIYFTVSSTRRPRRECNIVVMEADNTGRVLQYDLETKSSTVLLRDMRYPNGIALSKDGTFVLIASTLTNRVLKYWLAGPQAGNLEDFAHQPGYPDNIRSTEDGDFWVALHGRRTNIHIWLCKNGWASHLLFPVQQTYKRVDRYVTGQAAPMAIKYNTNGDVLDVLEDRTRTSHTQFLSNVQERDGIVWLSSIYTPIISFYPKSEFSRHNRSIIL